MDTKSPSRPRHTRNASSKTGIWKTLVASAKPSSSLLEPVTSSAKSHAHSSSLPLLPPGHLHAVDGRVLGERQSNAQSRSSSDNSQANGLKDSECNVGDLQSPSKQPTGRRPSPHKTKSSSNLTSVFAKLNRSHKDLSSQVHKDKENTTPPVTSREPVLDTPIWAQFATTNNLSQTELPREGSGSNSIHDEIARYTPQEYSPSKQRNFNGTYEQPSLRPTLSSSRPQSGYSLLPSEGIVGAIGRRVSGGRASSDTRNSGESARNQGKEQGRRASGDQTGMMRRIHTDRKVSGSSTEQVSLKEKLNIAKRGGRVMAAVAALQGKPKEAACASGDAALEANAVDEAFEAVLAARNIPEAMRQKMRTLTLRVKADFVKQDQEQSKTSATSTNTASGMQSCNAMTSDDKVSERNSRRSEEEPQSSKRSRARSRTFTFSKGDKRNIASPTKRQRSGSKPRPTSIQIPNPSSTSSQSTPATPNGSFGRLVGPPSTPATYITYLKTTQDPTQVEVGRLHKLRILLRNETVAWVNDFTLQGGMAEIVGLLHRTMAIEWREDHEDQVLHETLLCLKALCTAECAMAELDTIADDLFPALLAMLFDDEKKGPAEYATRTIIINVLFNFLASATSSPAEALDRRAHRILAYLGEPAKPEDARPVDFVLGMHVPRPYKLWCREVTHVTKEVFWIFLHHLNVVPLPKPRSAGGESTSRASVRDIPMDGVSPELATTYTQRHFPGVRPPVPAAPYIGGVEWDATTYLTAHLDLLNGLIASLSGSAAARNALRDQLQASGFEKVLGGTLRTCKEKFYSGVHDGLRAWVAAAAEDGWETRYVREGPTEAERAEKALRMSPKKNPKKKKATKQQQQKDGRKNDDDDNDDEAPKLGHPLPAGGSQELLPLELKLDLHMTNNNNDDGARDDHEDDDGWIG